MKKTPEREALEEIAEAVAESIRSYRRRFGHDPVICTEHVTGSKPTPDCTQLQVLGAEKESPVIVI